MEEINLDLESNSHKSIDLNSNSSSNNNNNINIIKNEDKNEEKKESNIGIDLLMNKSKSGSISDTDKTIEFRPKDPVLNTNSNNYNNSINFDKSDSINKSNSIYKSNSINTINLTDIGSSNNNASLNNSTMNNSSSINLEPKNTSSNDLDLNLDDLFKDEKPSENKQESNIELNIQESPEKKKTFEELQNEKAEFLRLLERLEKKGIHSHKKFNMNTDYSEIKSEFERLSRQRECDQSVKFQRKMLIALVTGIEFLNTKFDPFDIKLEGWSENIHEGVNDYDDIFEELHEKYKSKATMAPELRLLFMLGGSGFMFHLTNTMFKSSLPGMGDIMKQNPDLMRQFAQATASSMSEKQPGFGNFMGDILGGGRNNNQQPPPPQINRKEMEGPPNINDILNNMNSNKKIDLDLNSNYSESDIENSRGKRSINLDL